MMAVCLYRKHLKPVEANNMVKVRIIPCLDVREGRVVKGVNFLDLVDAGDPVEHASLYDKMGADELVLLDITASCDNREILYTIVSKVADHVFMPFTVGGGVRTVEDIRKLLLAGADKVSINSAAIYNPAIIRDAAQSFGSQCITVAVDARATECSSNSGRWEVFSHGGRKAAGLDLLTWVQTVQDYGAGEILLTSMDRDGTHRGFDLDMLKAVSEAVTIPVIASGGVGTLKHLVEGITVGKANAVLAASIFHFGKYTVGQVKQYMKDAGIDVRL